MGTAADGGGGSEGIPTVTLVWRGGEVQGGYPPPSSYSAQPNTALPTPMHRDDGADLQIVCRTLGFTAGRLGAGLGGTECGTGAGPRGMGGGGTGVERWGLGVL